MMADELTLTVRYEGDHLGRWHRIRVDYPDGSYSTNMVAIDGDRDEQMRQLLIDAAIEYALWQGDAPVFRWRSVATV